MWGNEECYHIKSNDLWSDLNKCCINMKTCTWIADSESTESPTPEQKVVFLKQSSVLTLHPGKESCVDASEQSATGEWTEPCGCGGGRAFINVHMCRQTRCFSPEPHLSCLCSSPTLSGAFAHLALALVGWTHVRKSCRSATRLCDMDMC